MKIKTNKSILILMLMMIFSSAALTQTPSGYLCSVRNDSLLTSKIYEFDIYLQNTDPVNIFELATFQAGILVNSSILNGGTITATIVGGSSQLVSAQRPTAVSFVGNPDYVIRLAPRLGPGQGAGTIIPLSAPGTRVARIRLTNTADFGQFSPNFVFNFTALPYNTIVSAYDQTTASNVVITNSANHTVATMINPILNSPITTSYSVTGSGNAPSVVGLDGSQTGGVNYELYKNSSAQGTAIDGNGSSISFGAQPVGTYTVTGHRKATYMYAGMNGSAIVTTSCNPVTIGIQPGNDNMCATSGNASFTVTANGDGPFTYQWQYYNGSTWVNVTNGTPSGASYTNATTATLNVAGINTVGSYLYHCFITNCSGASTATSNSTTLTVNPNPTVNVGGVMAPICQGGTTAVLGGSFGGGATSAVWSDGGAGGSFTNNGGSTPNTTTYTASAAAPASVTLTLTTSGGSCGTTFASKSLTVNPNPIVNVGGAIAAICQGGTTSALGGSFGGGATSAVWSDGAAGGSFTNNAGGTPNTATYTASPVSGSPVTLRLTSAGGLCGTTFASKSLTVNAKPAVVDQTTTISSGGTFTVTPGGVPVGTTYSWAIPTYTGGVTGGSAQSGQTNISGTLTIPSGTGTATYTVTPTSGTCIGGAFTVTVTVNSTCTPVSIVTQPVNNSMCTTSGTASFTVGANGTATITYQWQYFNGSTWASVTNGTPAGAIYTNSTTATLNVAGITTAGSPQYHCYLTNCSGGNNATSSAATLTVNATPSAPTLGIITQPSCALATGSIQLTGLPAGNWTINPGAIAGSTPTYTIPGLVAGTYAYTVTTAAGCISLSSANVIINAQPPTPIVNNQTTSISSGGTFVVTPSGATIPVGTTYTWPAPTYTGLVTGGVAQGSPQLSISGTLTNPSGTGTAIYTVTPVSGTCTGATFTVTVTVNSTCVPVSITTQPGNSTVCAVTGTAPFTVVASGTGPFTYQWQYNNGGIWGSVANGVPAGAVYTNAATATMNVTGISAVATYQYRCIITNCSGGNTILSNTATLTINAPPVPTLTSSDADNIFCFGTSVIFTAGGGGVGATYDFRINGVTIQTGPSTTYTTTSLANSQTVTVVVTNANLCSATSAGIANFVNQPPYISVGPIATCSTDFLTYSVVLTVSTGTVTSTSGIVANTGGNNWRITGILAGVNITITITDINGCLTPQLVTAPNCLCPILLPPVSGGDRSYCAGGVIPTLSATVAAGGNPKTVDWYNSASGGIPLLSGSLTYTPSVAGTYYALTREIVSNCVSSTRTPIVLTMNPLPIPTLTSSDADNIFCSGTSVIFSATGGTSYNFFVSGTSQQNSALATYTTSALTNGQAVNVVVTNVNGCIATAGPITNTVNPTPTPTLTSSDADNTFCAGTSITFTAGGGTSFDFRIGGISVQNGASAVYTTSSLTNGQVVNVIVSNANGCAAASPNITNTVNPTPVPTLTSSDVDNIFCAGTSITFTASGGTTYNFRVGSVSAQNGASNTYVTNSLTNGQVVTVIVGNSIGCTVTSSGITNTVNPQPTTNGGTGGNSCDLSFKLSAVPSIGIGTWSTTTGPGTATFAPNANTANATVTVSEYGTYTFTWTEISGTCSGSSVVTVNFYLQPVVNAGTGGNNCGLEFYFNASLNAGIGTWSKVSGPGNVTFSPDANTANALVTVTVYGSYSFMWTVVNGICTNSANVTVVFIQQAPANAGSGGSECDKDFILNALVPATGTGTWTKFSGPGNPVFTPDNHQSNATVTVDQFGTYEFAWTVVNSTCTSSDIVKVVFHDLPSINAGRDTVMCKGGSIQLHAVGPGSVSWTPVALVSNPNILNPVAMPDVTTTFSVNLTDQFGCKNSDGIVIEVREKPIADAGPDQVFGYLFESQMDALLAHDYEKGVWSVISGTGEFSDSTYAKSSVTSLSSGDNLFLWIVSNGFCLSSNDTVMITVNEFIIPTLITPNMDGRNDYFVLKGLATLGKTELVIFDRRGAQVYRNLNYDNSWNGVDYNKNPLPDDTYFFVLKTANGKSISGYIVIRR